MNIYVGNISRESSEAEIRALFEEFGEIDKIRDNYTKMLKGFGFVEMTDQTAAEKAIKELDGQMFNGRPLTVNVAKPPKEKSEGDNRRGRFTGNRTGGGGGNRGGGGGNRYNSGY